jgi:hypothetical protein
MCSKRDARLFTKGTPHSPFACTNRRVTVLAQRLLDHIGRSVRKTSWRINGEKPL